MNPTVQLGLNHTKVQKIQKDVTECSARLQKASGVLGTIRDTHPATLALRKAMRGLQEAEALLDTAMLDHSFFTKKP
jgi:hypothetical protein